MQIQTHATKWQTVFLAVCYASIVSAADFEKLTIPGDLSIVVDPCQSPASVSFMISNDTEKPSKLNLRIGELVSTATHTAPHGATAKLIFLNAGEEAEKQPESLDAAQKLEAKVELSGFLSPSPHSLTLFNGPTPLGQVQVAGLPFQIHPEIASNTPMPVVVVPDSVRFTVKNDDALIYPVKWELTFGSTKVKGTAHLGPNLTEIACSESSKTDHCEWSRNENAWEVFCHRLRDSSFDGRLRIVYAGTGQAPIPDEDEIFAANVAFPVKVALRGQSPEMTTFLGSMTLVLVLALGAFASLVTNLWIPHNLRKNALQSRLTLAIRRVRELSSSMPSRGRISAEVDCFQIVGRLKNEGAFYSDFDSILSDYEVQVAAIETRVEFMSQVDECQRVLDGITTLSVPPSLISRAREPLELLTKMFDGGEWNETQLRAAAALVDNLLRRVAALSEVKSTGKIELDVQSEIRIRLKRLKEWFPPTRTGIVKKFADAVPGLFETLDETPDDPQDVSSLEWARLDITVQKLCMIRRFISAYEGASNPEWKSRLELKAGFADPLPDCSLIYYLELNTWDALICAEMLCAQIDQGIFPEHICQAICDGRFSIEILQKQVTSERRVDVEINFSNYAYNNAAARFEITPQWTFTPHQPRSYRTRLWNFIMRRPDSPEPRKESGWGVSCLVRPYKTVEAHVCFEDWFGEVKVKGADDQRSKSYPIESNSTGLVWARFIMELSKLGLGLAIPVLGLLAGAREKLLTMDVSAALATVFILGFGADTIKNALTRGTVSIPGPTPPKQTTPPPPTPNNVGMVGAPLPLAH